jgi:DNA-directed RNA polymerase specialized sigma24 family protein
MAIRLVDLNGWSYRQAAGAMAVSTAAFKSAHFRARQRLAGALRMRLEDDRKAGVVVQLRRRKPAEEEIRRAA